MQQSTLRWLSLSSVSFFFPVNAQLFALDFRKTMHAVSGERESRGNTFDDRVEL